MKTTALKVEILIIGFQSLIWVSLLVLSVWGHEWIDLRMVKEFMPLVILMILGLSYTLGIIFNKLAAFTFAPWNPIGKRLLPRFWIKQSAGPPYPAQKWIRLIDKHPDIAIDLQKRADESTLLRGTLLNLVLTLASSIVYIGLQEAFSTRVGRFMIAITVIMIILTIFSWKKSVVVYYTLLDEAYKAYK